MGFLFWGHKNPVVYTYTLFLLLYTFYNIPVFFPSQIDHYDQDYQHAYPTQL
jgi:hypothetical protein